MTRHPRSLAAAVYHRVNGGRLLVTARRLWRNARLPRWFWRNLAEYNSRYRGSLISKPADKAGLYPIVTERTATVGFDPHYIYHVAWAARILAGSRPARHVDFGSALYFPTICSAFLTVEHYDYREPDLHLEWLTTGTANLTALPFADDTLPSVSCMHVVEHVGLGRYGDPLDPDGDRKAIHELQRVTAPSGQLLFVVPVGRERVMFNAHRIYAYDTVIRAFDGMELEEFSLITLRDHPPRLIRQADPALVALEDYGCGCFLFTKKANVPPLAVGPEP